MTLPRGEERYSTTEGHVQETTVAVTEATEKQLAETTEESFPGSDNVIPQDHEAASTELPVESPSSTEEPKKEEASTRKEIGITEEYLSLIHI